jgi:hypothetical protein
MQRIIAGLWLLAAGCVRPVPIEGAACPCPATHLCCPTSNRCVARIEACPDSPGGGPPPAGDAGAPGPMASPDADADAGNALAPSMPAAVPLHRLGRGEYARTVRDLLGVTPSDDLMASLPADRWSVAIPFTVGATIQDPSDLRLLMYVAQSVATTATANLATLLPLECTAPRDAAAEGPCAHAYVTQLGLRAFRRPLTGIEEDDLLDLFLQRRAAAGSYGDGIRVVTEAMLESPFFLYRWEEVGPPVRDGMLVRLGGYEIAARLSYFLWSSMPDQALFAAAAAGRLLEPDDIEAQARRMLADPRAQDGVDELFFQWLGLSDLPDHDKDPVYKGYSRAVARDMLAETAALLRRVLLGRSATGSLETLLSSNTTAIPPSLAAIYDVPGVAVPGLSDVTLDPARRAGLLTQASFLAAHAGADDRGVVPRGRAVFERLLCRELPQPNADVPVLPDRVPGSTTREAFEQLTATGCTKGCHDLYQLGYAFLNYDAIGAYQSTEVGKVIDASGAVGAGAAELRYLDAVDLSRKLAALPEVADCLGRQWLRFMLRRGEGPGDAASLAAAGAVFRGSRLDLRELSVALVRTPAFTHRLPRREELAP